MAGLSAVLPKAVGDRMLLGMQGFDFCPNQVKFYPIYPNLPKFYLNLPTFAQILLKLA